MLVGKLVNTVADGEMLIGWSTIDLLSQLGLVQILELVNLIICLHCGFLMLTILIS